MSPGEKAKHDGLKYYVELSDCGRPYEWTLYVVGTRNGFKAAREAKVYPDSTPGWEMDSECRRMNEIVEILKASGALTDHDSVLAYKERGRRSGEAEAAYKEGMAFGHELGEAQGRKMAFCDVQLAIKLLEKKE